MKATHLSRKTALRFAISVLIITAMATVSRVNAGDLFPPGGPILPTNRVQLSDQVTTLPFTINSPGSYVLTSSLTGSSGSDGIIIDASDVTLELNGFSLVGVVGSLDGIRVTTTSKNVAIQNGMITSWGGIGLNAGGGPEHQRLTDLSVNENGSHGIVIGSMSHVMGLSACDNGGAAIRVEGVGNRVDECHVTENGIGIEVVGVDNLIVRNSAFGNTVADFSIVAGNAFGPIVSVGGIGDISSNPSAIHPWANFALTCVPTAEICDGLDNDCNGTLDDGAGPTWCEDVDGDGFGNAASTIVDCVQQPSFVSDCTDCDDFDPSRNSGAAELCDGIDNDCDGSTDNGNPGGGGSCSTGLQGVCAAGILQCSGGQLVCAQVSQPGPEVCFDSLDNNCDGAVDEGCGGCVVSTECAPGESCCGGVCIDTQSDTGHCGACGNTCSVGQICSFGACQCPSGQTNCFGLCVDLSNDSSNCGICGSVCGPNESCSAGTCSCDTGFSDCIAGNGCETSTSSDANNCGGCGNVCAIGASCVSSVCQCPPGELICFGICTNLGTDPNNCGSCGFACGSGESCVGAACVP